MALSKPVPYEEVAVTSGLFPSKEAFWKDFVRRRPRLDQPTLRHWFLKNARFTMEEQRYDQQGRYTAKMRCAICSNNWSGFPVAPHSADNCPIPKDYQLRFIATNTPAVCLACFGRPEFHVSCRKHDEFCKRCRADGKGIRNHVPMARVCHLKRGEEEELFNELRVEHYERVRDISNKEPLAIQMENDKPMKPYFRRDFFGIPPLNVPLGTYGPVHYKQNSYFQGIIPVYKDVDRDLVDHMLRDYQKAKTDQLAEQKAEEEDKLDLVRKVESVSLIEGSSAETGKLYEKEESGSKITFSVQKWNELIRHVDSLWITDTKEVEELRIRFSDAKPVMPCGTFDGFYTPRDLTYDFTKDQLEKVVKEMMFEDKPKETLDKILALQMLLTGQSEQKKYIGAEGFFGWLGTGEQDYFELLRDFTIMLTRVSNPPYARLQSVDKKEFPFHEHSKRGITIPSANCYISYKLDTRKEIFKLWLHNVAQTMPK
ncbi:hypothetical protein CRE_23256 [Caenorhabditis remanei]|uniref:Uncharacterized protein n=1 Tax=Caenorhabditis remanei TaxID=31234 RepID=E3NRU0_CAERE|nr:hypothetical protein CRE_23256 [Caenorhabditis remanei]